MFLPIEQRPEGEARTKPDNRIVHLLKRARQLIEREEDWCQHGWGDDTGPRCGEHALVAAFYQARSGYQIDDYQTAYSYLSQVAGGGAGSFGRYNDTHYHDEVLAKFDQAIWLASN